MPVQAYNGNKSYLFLIKSMSEGRIFVFRIKYCNTFANGLKVTASCVFQTLSSPCCLMYSSHPHHKVDNALDQELAAPGLDLSHVSQTLLIT